ncbi:MAG TPA: metallophosphoesterase [Acidobacteriaceae bacterium]
MTRCPLTLALFLLLFACPAFAARRISHHRHAAHHRHAPRKDGPAAAPVSALFLSDIHFDPLRDPIKAPRLNEAPVDQWAAILASPASPTQEADYAAINQLCPIKPLVDPSDQPLQSALTAIHDQAKATHVRFAVLSGDIVTHQFDCRYKLLFPKSTHAEYLAFVVKTFNYAVSSLRKALPGIPLYIAVGNNDTGCGDNKLNPRKDDFLRLTAPTVADALPTSDRARALRDFPRGYYGATLPARIAHTRILVLDNLYESAAYKTCAAQPDPAAEDPQLVWLSAQLKQVRARHQQAWVVGHIPPGVNLYSTYNLSPGFCGSGTPPAPFLADNKLNDLLAANADVVRLALFGHSHTDELRLLKPPPDSGSPPNTGVPLKILPSISPVFANLPSFTLATIDPRTATLQDSSVVMASNSTGIGTVWSKTYTFSEAYHLPDFSAGSLTQLITEFQSDPAADKPESQAYLRENRHYFFDDHSAPLQPNWRGYACAMDHISAASFTACACSTRAPAP